MEWETRRIGVIALKLYSLAPAMQMEPSMNVYISTWFEENGTEESEQLEADRGT